MSVYDPEHGYLRDLLDQPIALADTLAGLEDGFALSPVLESIQGGAFRRILLTGMGSSFHVFYPAFYTLAERGLPVQMIETGELVHYAAGLLGPETLVVAASQSGRSAEIVRLLDLAKARGVPILGVSNTPGSPLAQRSAASLMTRAGAEATVSCKTYVASLLALSWLADALSGQDLQAARRESRDVAGLVQSYLAGWREHVASLEKRLAGVEHVFLAGRGSSLAACGTGALITKESAHVHAEGMSSAALRHGPLEMLGPGCFGLVFAGDARTLELNARLAEDLHTIGIPNGWVAPEQASGPFALPDAPERLRPILEILPVEMMTLALAGLSGRVAGVFERGSKVTTVE